MLTASIEPVLYGSPTTVDEKSMTCDQGCSWGHKKYDCSCNVRGLTYAVQRSNALDYVAAECWVC